MAGELASSTDRRYDLKEIDTMRSSLISILEIKSRRARPVYAIDFNTRGYACGGWAHSGESSRTGEKSPDERRAEHAEELLRTHMMNGTSPDELVEEVGRLSLDERIREALYIVSQRRRTTYPEPENCPYVRLLKEHGKYTPDTRDREEIVKATVARLCEEEGKRVALRRLLSCGHIPASERPDPHDECGACDHGLLAGFVVTTENRPFRCAVCRSMSEGRGVWGPDIVGRDDSPEDILKLSKNTWDASLWCLSCAKRRMSHGQAEPRLAPVEVSETMQHTASASQFDYNLLLLGVGVLAVMVLMIGLLSP